jgi:trimethylamine--corrinoid protein Co-methyltransferase
MERLACRLASCIIIKVDLNLGGKIMEKGLIGGQYKPLSQDIIGRIHSSALRVLEEVGVKVNLPEALEVFSRAGANVDAENMRVKIPARLVEKCIGLAPSTVILYGRKPKNNLTLENARVYMGTGGAAPNVIDPYNGQRRPSKLQDIAMLAKLTERLENIHFFTIPCTAQDVPQEKRSINEFYAAISNTSKHIMGSAQSPQDVQDVIDMASTVYGGQEKLRKKPFISFVTSWMVSPLTFDPGVTKTLIEIINRGMPVALSSAPMAGATSPITMAGTLTQLHAEELSGIVFSQLLKPGAPILYGGIPGMADMHDLRYKAGGVEFGFMNAAISQLATYIDVPNYCSAGITDAKIPSMQAIYEKSFSVCQCALAGANYVHHAAGVLESILTVCYSQLVIDNEIIGMAMKMIKGLEIDADRLAFSEIKKVGPGGNFFSTSHTRRYLRSEYIEPVLIPRSTRTYPEVPQEHLHSQSLYYAREKAKELIEGREPLVIPHEIDKSIRERYEILL